jgi:high-affinity iron transporter
MNTIPPENGTARMTARFLAALAAAAAIAALPAPAALAQSKFSNWTEIAQAMNVSLGKAYDVYAAGGQASWEEARDWVNDAYFGYYEKEGFERMVKSSISGKRASTVEYKFATIKTKLKDGADATVIRAEIDALAAMLEEDATALDVKFGLAKASAEGEAAGGATAGQEGAASAASGDAAGAAPAAGGPGGPGGGTAKGTSFFMSLGILLREGFEAILVIAAIAAYLKRCGMHAQIRTVYWSSAAAVLVSFLAAIALQAVFAVSGAKQEILEGFTMLLATAVLFGVSNWMFSKAEAEAWKDYIQGKVQAAVTTGSSVALGAAAFLAVFREGAETILFYQSLFAAGADATMIWSGFAVGCVGLAVIFVVIRHGTQIIPLKPFFIGTSILMFLMSVSFLGGGIKELQEGDVFGVSEELSFVPTVDILGLYPYLETLIPQAVLVLLAVASIVWIKARRRPAGLGGARGAA